MKSLFTSHFSALIIKRLRIQKKDWVGIICELIFPFLFIISGLLLMGIKYINTEPEVELKTD